MDFVTNARLMYLGFGAHEILAAQKANWVTELGQNDNRRLAEWMIDKVSYQNNNQEKWFGYGIEIDPLHSYLNQLHRDYEEDLRHNRFIQNPTMNDLEAVQMVYEPQMEELLADIPKEIDVTIG